MKASLVAFFMLLTFYTYGQGLRGRVIDPVNSIGLEGANVRWSSGVGTSTDISGGFNIPFSKPDTLIISFVGYQSKTIWIINSRDFLRIGIFPEENMLPDVVVTAFNLDTRQRDIPGSVGLFGKREIERDNETTIVAPLNRIPGVYMQSGAYNTNRLTIRGIGSRSPFSTTKLRAYFNAIPLTTGDGETTIEDTDLDLINRVEILRGPSSSVYGAGLGGTVLLQMADPTQSSLKTNLIAGSFGLLKSNNSVMLAGNKAVGGISYQYMHSDGYRENNNYDRQTITGVGKIQIQDKTSLSIYLSAIDLIAFIPSSIDSSTFAENPSAAAPTWANSKGFEDTRKLLGGLSMQHYFKPGLRLDVSLFSSGRDSYELRPFNILEEKSTALGTRTQLILEKKRIKTSFGFEYFNEKYDWQTFANDVNEKGTQLADNKETRRYLNVFGQGEVQFGDRWFATLGLNINQTGYDLEDNFNPDSTNQSGTYKFELIASPRVALSYRTQNGQTYATISHGFSPPSFSETLAPNGLINPDIRPEQGINYELGHKGLYGNIGIDIALFTMNIEDLIVARRDSNDQFIGLNAGKTSHTGLEFQVDYNYVVGKGELHPFLGYTLANYKFVEFVDGDDDYSGNELTGVPKHVFNIGVDFTFGGLFGNISYQNVGEMPLRDDNSKYSEQFGITNLKIGYTKNVSKWDFGVSAGVNNLFDAKYASMIQPNAPSFGGREPRYYYPGLPVNYFGGIKLMFNF